MMRRLQVGLIALVLAACTGGDSPSPANDCSGQCANATTRLQVSDVERVLAQAVTEAQAQGAAATIAVVDRVGNVLGVFRMSGADTEIRTDGGRGVDTGLDGITIIPDSLAAIAKAVTAAYLSSEGNAFTTRTANQIVQEFFNPGERGQPGGPLFGVQFSSLPCSDVSTRLSDGTPGPHRSPLGLAADPGGIPLYIDGTPVGAVGVIADGVYGLDASVGDRDRDIDEIIALAATAGFEAPVNRRANRVTVEGKTFRFIDAQARDLQSNPAAAPTFASLDTVAGDRVSVRGYTPDAQLRAGVPFGTPASGIRPATGTFAAFDADILVDAGDSPRFAPRGGTDAASLGATPVLTAGEVETLLVEGLRTASRARAQIRRPHGSAARVTVAVVDTHGQILGLVRAPDAPMFGTDVAVQKARTASFFSNAAAAGDLQATPDTTYLANGQSASIADYVDSARTFLDAPTALSDGAVAFSDRAGGNLSRPFYPDGQAGAPNGPFSRPIEQWSAFSVGLQSDLVNSAVLQHVVFTIDPTASDVAAGACTELPDTASGAPRLPNGIQIFPGSVPIYRGNELVGGIGVSGDGVDQDDMIAFLAVHEAGLQLGTLGNAPPGMRADQLTPKGARLRYVQCPIAPFNDSDEQLACTGK